MTPNTEKARDAFLFYQKQRSGKRSKIEPFIKYFLRSDTVLDIGCGTGIELVVASGSCGHAVGIDIDVDCIRIAKERSREKLNIDLVRSDACHLPFRLDCFSKILCFDVLEHLISFARLINDMKRLLRSNGEVILRVPNRWSIHEILLMLASPLTKGQTGTWYVRHVSFFDCRSIRKAFVHDAFEYVNGYTYGGLGFNMATTVFALASIILNIMFYIDPLKKESVLSALMKHYPKPKYYIIISDSRLPSFGYLTLMFRSRR